MKIRTGHWCTFALIFLLSLLGFAAQAHAQGSRFNLLSAAPKLPGKTGKTRRAKLANATPGYSYMVLYNFCAQSKCADGSTPYAGLVQDAAGNLYGTTESGGISNSNCSNFSCGTVFKLDTNGNETVLHNFCSAPNCTDGMNPQVGLIQDAAGNLYGTTESGGIFDPNCSGGSCGTVFKLDTAGHYTVLYSFCTATNCTDGANPAAGLIQDAAGNLYGTTVLGGASGTRSNSGTVFKLDSTGRETVLYSFCSVSGCYDGVEPAAGLLQDAAGNLYGTTYGSGNHSSFCGLSGCGTVFKLDNTGQETVLVQFICSLVNCPNGANPVAGLIQDAAGNLYGTTIFGGLGTSEGGVVFEVKGTDQETVLYSFGAAGSGGGLSPYATLLQDAAGNLYGTTNGGGSYSGYLGTGGGTVFKLDKTGNETVLYSFCAAANCTDGAGPDAGLIEDAAGNLYGTAAGGGANGLGVVFKLVAPPTPTVTLTPSTSSISSSQALSVTITVTGPSGSPTPTGTVTLTSGTYSSGETTLANGSATINISAGSLASGNDTLTAAYSGDGNYNSAAGSNSVTVAPFSVAGTAASVSPGGTTTSTITVTPSGGFTGSVALTAAAASSPVGAQNPPTLSFGSTSPISITGASVGTATLTISTTAATSGALAYPPRPGVPWYAAGGTGLLAFVFFFGFPGRDRSCRTRIGLLIFLVTLTGGLLACGVSNGSGGGGTSNSGTTPGTYTVTVTGTSGSSTAMGTITLTVQ